MGTDLFAFYFSLLLQALLGTFFYPLPAKLLPLDDLLRKAKRSVPTASPSPLPPIFNPCMIGYALDGHNFWVASEQKI